MVSFLYKVAGASVYEEDVFIGWKGCEKFRAASCVFGDESYLTDKNSSIIGNTKLQRKNKGRRGDMVRKEGLYCIVFGSLDMASLGKSEVLFAYDNGFKLTSPMADGNEAENPSPLTRN